MRHLVALAVPLLIAAAPAPDKVPTTCELVGNFAFSVAEERMKFVPEEEAGRIHVPKSADPKLREIVHMVYETGLSPPSAGFFAWRICIDTAAEKQR